jgi:hypothetical protein
MVARADRETETPRSAGRQKWWLVSDNRMRAIKLT